MSTLGRPAARAPINTGDIPDNIITSAKIAPDVLTAADIAPNAVTASELADNAVDTNAVADDAVTYAKLQNLGTANRVLGSASTGVIGEVQIAAGMIADDAVTMAKLSATGTASADTFLRGDNSWQSAGSPSITDNGDANAMTIGSDESVTFVGATSIPSIKQTDAQNLSGTYTTHEMIMGKTFTVTGNLTVNTNLVLVNMSGTGDDVTIQDDGTATTITGTGTLEAGEMLGTLPQRTSVTGMTGIVGSGVTIGNATFPAGHVLQVQHGSMTKAFSSTTSGVWLDVGLKVTITPSSTSSKIFIEASVSGIGNSQSGYNTIVSILQPIADADANVVLSGSDNSYHDYNAQGPSHTGGNVTYRVYSWGGIDSPASTSALTYGVMIRGEGSGTSRTLYFNNSHSSTACYNQITAWEIAG